jgi:hypothetical protein
LLLLRLPVPQGLGCLHAADAALFHMLKHHIHLYPLSSSSSSTSLSPSHHLVSTASTIEHLKKERTC